MSFSAKVIKDPRVTKYYEDYIKHPFIQDLRDGTLEREKFKNYLIQDSLYLKEYGKVYGHVFLMVDRIEDLQFLHTCMGVVVSDETNMHTQYLRDYELDVYKVDHMEVKGANRKYLDYMLNFTKQGSIKEIFMSALPCTLTYEYIGKTLKKHCGEEIKNNYYGPWIEAYGGEEFEEFSVNSCKFLDRICKNIDEEEEEKLIRIFLQACEHEMKFWDMSYE